MKIGKIRDFQLEDKKTGIIHTQLGMNDTGFFVLQLEIPNLADLHHVGKEGGYEKIEDPFPDPTSGRYQNLGVGFPNHWG